MMEQLKVQNDLDSVPRPREWFDMIAGSNTGGCVHNYSSTFPSLICVAERRIITLFLGRLRMSVEEAIVAYMSFSEQVFSDAKWVGTQRYRSTKLEMAMMNIIRAKTGNSETRMINNSNCKV